MGLRKGQKLVNHIIKGFKPNKHYEDPIEYIDDRNMYLDAALFNMSDKEFEEAIK